jgi:hypothetical protein
MRCSSSSCRMLAQISLSSFSTCSEARSVSGVANGRFRHRGGVSEACYERGRPQVCQVIEGGCKCLLHRHCSGCCHPLCRL